MTPQEVKSLHEEVMKAVHDFRDAVDKRDAEVKELGSARLETKQLVEKLNSRIDDLEAALAKKTVEVKEKTGEAETAAVRATEKFLRYGLKGNAALDHMSDDERKSFSEMQKKSLFESADAQGGNGNLDHPATPRLGVSGNAEVNAVLQIQPRATVWRAAKHQPAALLG